MLETLLLIKSATLQLMWRCRFFWKTAAILSSFLSDCRNNIKKEIKTEENKTLLPTCPWKIQALVHLKVTSAKKSIFFAKSVLNIKWKNFCIWRNSNFSFSRYLDICVLVNPETSKSVKSSNALLHIRSYTFNYFFGTLGSTKMKFG